MKPPGPCRLCGLRGDAARTGQTTPPPRQPGAPAPAGQGRRAAVADGPADVRDLPACRLVTRWCCVATAWSGPVRTRPRRSSAIAATRRSTRVRRCRCRCGLPGRIVGSVERSGARWLQTRFETPLTRRGRGPREDGVPPPSSPGRLQQGHRRLHGNRRLPGVKILTRSSADVAKILTPVTPLARNRVTIQWLKDSPQMAARFLL